MTPDPRTQRCRMEEACRQTRRQLDAINRRIVRRVAAVEKQRQTASAIHRNRNRLGTGAAFLQYRRGLAARTAERQVEIDALCAALARQEHMVEALQSLEVLLTAA